MAPRTHEDAPGSTNGGSPDSESSLATDRPSESILGVSGGVAEERRRAWADAKRDAWPEDGGQLAGGDGLRQLAESRSEHTVPYGARDAFARNVQRLVAKSKDEMLEELYKPENVKAYLAAIEEGAKRKDRTSIRMLHEIYDLAGMRDALVTQFLARVGAASLEDVERKVQRIEEAKTMDAHQRAAACRDYLELYLNKHPEHRQGFVRTLGGYVEVRSDSFAEVADGP